MVVPLKCMSVFSSWEPVNVTFDGKGALSDIIKLRILRREDRPGLSKAGVLNQVASVLKTDIQRTWGRDHGGHAWQEVARSPGSCARQERASPRLSAVWQQPCWALASSPPNCQ